MKKPSSRWAALIILCLGVLMIVLDTTIVNVALPSIKSDLGFTDGNLAWIVNAYMLTSGGFLLLGGRLGDLYGPRKLFLAGLALFTAASVACGLAESQVFLVVMRAVQGLGAAVVTAVALALILNLFPEEKERAKAMGVYGFVCASGGSVGVLLGGVLVSTLDWHWIFWVNLPIGIAVFLATQWMIPESDKKEKVRLDIAGAFLITSTMLLTVYSIVNAMYALLAPALVLLILFILVESRRDKPLVPLKLFKDRNISIASVVGALWSAGMFSQFFISSLYLQQVLHYDPLKVGLSFLAPDLIMAVFSLGLSAKLVSRFGIKKPLVLGLCLCALSLTLLVRAPVDGVFLRDVLPSMLILGVGAGMGFNPLLLAAMQHIDESDSGIASGVVNTAFMMGGSLGLAILATLAAGMTTVLTMNTGMTELEALNGGYHAAFFLGAVFALIAAGLSFFLKIKKHAH